MVELTRTSALTGTGLRKVHWGRLASRAVIYASSESGGFAKAAREAAARLRAEIEHAAFPRMG